MDRIRDGRRGGVSVGGGPPPPRRRLRSNGGGGGGGGPRDSPRSERRRGERLMLNGGGGGAGRDDGDDTSDESLADDDDDAEEELAPRYQQQRRSPSTAPPPPSPPQPAGGHHHSSSSSGGGGGGGYHNHHHGQQHQMQRKGGGSNPKSPIVVKAVDEMIGVPVPRKARSASTKRSSHEWPVPGGGTSGGSAGAGDGSHIQRPSSRPISPASASTTAPARKKLKPLSGGSSGGPGPAPKQRPSPSPAPSTTPPQPQPPKISKSPSFIQEEIEVAEVLFGLTRQFPCPPPKQESNHKLEPRDAPEAKSGNSSPAPSSSGARPSDSTSLSTIAPKRKRPRLVKYDEDSRPASPAKPEFVEPSSKPEPPPVARSEAKTATSVAAESGTSTAPVAAAQHETSREPEKPEDRGRNRDSELRPSDSDRRDHRLESQAEQSAPLPAPSVKPDAEAKPVGSEARNGEATATTKIELASDGARQDKKFSIDLMAPPPGKLSDDIDDSSDLDADKKGLDSEMDMLGRGNSEKKDGERIRRGLDIDLEDQKVQRIPADEFVPKKFTLQLDLEKPSLGDEKSPSERRQQQPQPQQLQQQKPSKAEIKHEKSAMPAVTPPMPIPVGGWLGNFPPFGYLSPVPGLSAAGLHHPMDLKPGSSSGLQHAALLPPPTRSKRCATHCYIAQFIQHQQRVAKMNSFWPPAAAAAAAAAANRSGPFFGARPFGMGVVPPTDAASMLVNPMQGSYAVRAHTPMQEAKAPSMATSPFQGSLSKDKALGNAAGAESSQRKQPPAHETQQSTPMPNMLQAPAFIFPFNQQHAMVAAANAANRAGDAKSSGASNAMPPSASAHTSAANSGAAAMNLSFANLQPDAQFLAILQNGYPFQVAAHAGGPPYRGMAPPGPAVPFFNGHVYSSPMLHPSQQQGMQPQGHQKTQMPNLPSSSQKHQPQQSQGLLGYAPNANAAAAAASNLQNYSSGNQRPVLLPGLTHRQESDKTGQDGPSSDDKPSHSQKSGYEHNFAVPVHLPNFAMMPAAQPAGSQSEKKSSDHHHHQQQQQPQVSRGQGVRIDLASSQPFVMPFGSIGPGSTPTGLDFSALAQNPAVFQSHQEAARHGYPQLNFAAAQSMQSTQHKPQHGETKSVAGDSSSTPIAGDSERKKSTSTKYSGDSQQHSLSFTRTESKNYVTPFLSGSTNESSSRTLSLIGTESSNAFMGSKPTNSTTPASTPAAASSSISQQQQQQHQHFLQMQVQQKHQQHQQLIQHHHMNRPRSAAPSTQNSTGRYPDGLSMASFQNMMYPSSAAQGGVQSPQLKASSGRGTPSSTATTPPAAPPPNLIMMKNSSLHQQQAKVPMQALSTPGHQPPSSLSMNSSKMGPSVTNLSTGGGDLSRSSNAPVASGSPSNSVSKSTGGSPPATGNAKGVQQPVQLPSPQQQSAKNSASTSGSKSTPTNHFSMAMPSILGQQPNASPGSNPGSKQQSHMPPSSMKQPPFQQGHFFISNTYAPQAPGAGGAAALGLYQKRPGDKTQQQAPHQQNALSAAAGNNMKALHPSSGGFMHLAAATQSAGGVPHTHMSAAQLTFGTMPMPLKPSSDQKPAAGK